MGSPEVLRRAVVVVCVLVTVLSAGGAGSADAAPVGAAEVRLTFEGAGFGGQLPLSIAGGAVRVEPHGTGQAVRFPDRCPRYGAATCPRVVLQSTFTANPAGAAFRYGASVLLTADETAVGENVLQKGFSHGHGQFKLQVDGAAGQPSCVLVGSNSRRIYVVTAGVSVADGQWHTVECERVTGRLTVLVDGAIAGSTTVPAALSIVNSDPLRIGGKGLSPDNDQFHGAVDDAFVAIGAPGALADPASAT